MWADALEDGRNTSSDLDQELDIDAACCTIIGVSNCLFFSEGMLRRSRRFSAACWSFDYRSYFLKQTSTDDFFMIPRQVLYAFLLAFELTKPNCLCFKRCLHLDC